MALSPLEQVGLCLLHPIDCVSGAGRRANKSARAAASRVAEGTSGALGGALDRVEDSVDRLSDSVTEPLAEVSSIAMWVAIGFIAIAVVVLLAFLFYFLAPVVAFIRGLQVPA